MKFAFNRIGNLRELVWELGAGIYKLSFADNFQSFEKTVTILAASELEIRNELPFIPTKYIIVNQTGNGLITRETDWTRDYLYLTNHGAVSVTATVVFLK